MRKIVRPFDVSQPLKFRHVKPLTAAIGKSVDERLELRDLYVDELLDIVRSHSVRIEQLEREVRSLRGGR
jgi:hypothetical protein